MTFKRTVVYLSFLLGTAACVKPTWSNDQTVPLASSLIDNGLAALGGEEVVRNITGVTYQSPSYAATP